MSPSPLATTLYELALISFFSLFWQSSYHPLPIVFSKAQGIWVWDPEGRKYMDFLSSCSATNLGHCHPKVVKALCFQAQQLTLSSRAFYNNMFGSYAKKITEIFGYDMVLPTNTGAEAAETAIKLARRWGYVKKGIPENKAIVLSCEDNFHGRTTGAISLSTDHSAVHEFGPFLPLVGARCPSTGARLRFNRVDDLEAILEANQGNVAGFMVEPIQGDAG